MLRWKCWAAIWMLLMLGLLPVLGGCAVLAGAAAGGATGYVAGHHAGEEEAEEEIEEAEREKDEQ